MTQREIRKIKDNAAKFAKLHPGISQRQAEERLVAQAMREVDAAYYAKHADTDTASEQFLRSIAGSFKADGETFLDFAPMKYYRDSGKFADLYSQNWQEADLNAAIRKFVGTNPSVSFTPKAKAIYHGQNGIQIIHDIEGNYFRILDTKISGKRPYLDLNGNIPNNKINANGN